jgi:hypothetical protein
VLERAKEKRRNAPLACDVRNYDDLDPSIEPIIDLPRAIPKQEIDEPVNNVVVNFFDVDVDFSPKDVVILVGVTDFEPFKHGFGAQNSVREIHRERFSLSLPFGRIETNSFLAECNCHTYLLFAMRRFEKLSSRSFIMSLGC